jgi:hypothetical protein
LLRIGTNTDAVRVLATDTNGANWTGTAYIYALSAADALIAGSQTPVACTYDGTTDFRHECDITGSAVGTAKFKIIDAATVALATASSDTVSVTVGSGNPEKVSLSFDKASYAPGERVRIYVNVVDSNGKALPEATHTNLLSAGGISSNAALTFVGTGGYGSADSLTAVTHTTSKNASSTTGARPGSAVITAFMPTVGGTVTITAKGGALLPVANQVTVTASATVVDTAANNAASALAAVTALATTVASLKTLVTTLTNLVLKIQKKVKA